ncbi:hypothetical protein BT96DRAFT_954792 [Gymnopus androsaceus JB14]|uniref:protein-tyrosine-phosphatase n=1 Tax=Gymnopus androsaceus JB14 TaxID=1447944 RepID=A0A6A4I9J1_9AGAR|nr:hypothetical protein BT96DRAFT_954792 [Gymnopus androsaceus JB14]
MDQVIPRLWIGGLPSAMDTENLKANKIFSVLSAMRGKISIHEEEDVLIHLLPAITFIQANWTRGEECRSAMIVAAYLMHIEMMSVQEALEVIRKARPEIDPNPGFLAQLEIFHNASFKISRKDKSTRMFYMERRRVMNGDGSLPSTDMFARPLKGPRRRIRCKMCRQELAAREHMLDHGQLASRRPSTNQRHEPPSRRSSRLGSDSRPRRPSGLSFGGLGDSLSIPLNKNSSSAIADDDDDDEEGEPTARPLADANGNSILSPPLTATPKRMAASTSDSGRRPSAPQSDDDDDDVDDEPVRSPQVASPPLSPPNSFSPTRAHASPLASPNDLAAQLYANPKLTALRGASGSGIEAPSQSTDSNEPKMFRVFCRARKSSMQWMEPFLETGDIAGKIVCPNKKCGAKLGNYDWAGVCCGCKEWVVPGFCISRSKVDEIVA